MELLKTLKTIIIEDYEAPEYEVLNKLSDTCEIRKYPTLIWATAQAKGKFNDSEKDNSSTLFRKLFRYISGDNEANQKIAMTVPVTMDYRETNKDEIKPDSQVDYDMRFFVPKELHDKSPKPKGESMDIVKEENQVIASYKFGGFPSTEKFIAARDELVKTLGDEAKNYDTKNFITAVYNAPFRLFWRTNELWLRKIV